jgi:gas vesicle protein
MGSRAHSRMSGVSLLGLAVGVAAGAAAGLLLAPARGQELRSSLNRRARDAQSALQGYAASARSWADSVAGRVESRGTPEPLPVFAGAAPQPGAQLTATLSEINSTHGNGRADWETLS